MGKHSRRKSGYLPRVAAGAAPVALLFAAPATALAAQSDLTLPGVTLPLGHKHEGSYEHTAYGDATDSKESTVRTDRHLLRLGDVTASTANTQRLAQASTTTFAEDERRVAAGEGLRNGVWLADGVDVLADNAEQADGGVRRTTASDGRFAGDLAGGLRLRRTSGHAVDLGDAAAFGVTSEQHATGQFLGSLSGPGQAAGTFGQAHALGGQAGPVSGLVTTNQNGTLDQLSGSISGDLGVEHVVRAHGGETTSVRGRLTDQPMTQTQVLSADVFDRPALDLR